MGRIDGYSTIIPENKLQIHQQQPESSHQPPLQPSVEFVSQPQQPPQPPPPPPQQQQNFLSTAHHQIPVGYYPQIYQQAPAQVPHGFYAQPPPATAFQPQPVVVQCPPQATYSQPQMITQGWRTGLFDCMDDPENALITVCCPCVTFGQIAEILDYGQTSCATSGTIYAAVAFCIALPCLVSCTYRTKLRSRFGLIESPAPDWMTHFFCEYCALCQEYRELHKRGLDPSIGWLGNMAKNQNTLQQQQLIVMAPPQNQMMTG